MQTSDALSLILGSLHPLLAQKPRVIAAIDGMAASGKTTLCAALQNALPSCAVVHMDDFTLPFENRYPGYFDAQLANADVARFDAQVLTPLRAGQDAVYRPYRCHPQPGFLAPVTVPADTRCILVEGAYCLHPALFDRYDLRALMTIDSETQRRRILARNGEAQLARFLSDWIPMENRHIQSRDLLRRCDIVIG